jgi:3-oxoisoapionate decarboxylase
LNKRPIGISSYALPHSVARGDIDGIGILDLGIELGVDVIQFCENIEWENYLIRSAKGVDIALEFGTSNLLDENGIQHCIDHASHAGADFFRLVIDGPEFHPDLPEIIDACRSISETTNLKIGIENHDRFSGQDLIQIIEGIGPDRAGIVLDTANSLGCFESPEETLRLLGPYSICLHWKPIRIDRISSKLGFDIRGCPSDQSPLPLDQWISGTNGSIILEQWTPEGFTFEQELEWLKSSLSHIRSAI